MGIRQGECLVLTWNDVYFKSKSFNINKTLKSKGEIYTISPTKTQSSLEYCQFQNVP